MANVQRAIDSLRRRGFAVMYFETAKEAADYLDGSIRGKTVGIGGSMTIRQMGLYDRLVVHNTVYSHWQNKDMATRVAGAEAQVYLCSANAIAETGEIVNIDGGGNRIAATLFHHERMVFVAGVNKLTPDLDSANYRARNVAAPLNARRVGSKTPCATAEVMKCYDCGSEDCGCNGVVTLLRPMRSIGVTEVVLVGEELGY